MNDAVNKAVTSMRLFQLVDEWDLNQVKMFGRELWAAGYDYRGKELQTRKVSKIEQFNREDKKIEGYATIKEASAKSHYSESTIFRSLRGEVNHTKKGHYFKYASNENTL